MNQIFHQETPFGWLAFEVQQNVLGQVRWIDTPDYVNVSPVLTVYVKSLLEGKIHGVSMGDWDAWNGVSTGRLAGH